jgi:RHS repeat-associated protein
VRGIANNDDHRDLFMSVFALMRHGLVCVLLAMGPALQAEAASARPELISAQTTDADNYSVLLRGCGFESSGSVQVTAAGVNASYSGAQVVRVQGTCIAGSPVGVGTIYTVTIRIDDAAQRAALNATGLTVFVRNGVPGSGGWDSNSLVVRRTAPNQPPTIQLTAPTQGATFQAPTSVLLTATASDAEGPLSDVRFYLDGSLVHIDTTSPYRYTLPSVAPGEHTVKAKAIDWANAQTWSNEVTFTVQPPPSQPPSVTLTSPAEGTHVPAPGTFLITANATDPDNGIDRVVFEKVNYLFGGGLHVEPLNTDVASPYSFTWSNVPAGNYLLRATVYDQTSLSASSQIVSVAVDPPPNQLPSVTLTAPANNATFPADQAFDLAATAADPDGRVVQVVFYADGVSLGADTTAPYTARWSGAVGAHTLTAKVMDDRNAEVTSAPVNVQLTTGLAGVPDAPITSLDSELPAHVIGVGATPGTADVDGGQAVYTLPIAVPPGRSGMQPALSLSYGSRDGNGVAGMGWSLKTGSAISRCAKTLEQDGETVPVRFAADDALCLDGTRLIQVSTGPGLTRTFRTEIENYARITEYTSEKAGSYPCFKVEDKSGEVRHYGAVAAGGSCASSSANARVFPAGAIQPLSWLVEKTEDRLGNNMHYAYTAFGSGENLLRSIRYTGFGSGQGDRRVELSYEPRTADLVSSVNDTASSYMAGTLSRTTQRLKTISTFVGSSPVRDYRLGYGAPSAGSTRSLLRTVTECAYQGAAAHCRQPTVISWQEAAPSFVFRPFSVKLPDPASLMMAEAQLVNPVTALENLQPNPLSGSPADIITSRTAGDIDGDGSMETLASVRKADGSFATYLLSLSADRDLISEPRLLDLPTYGQLAGAFYSSGDANNDGRADLIGVKSVSTTPLVRSNIVVSSVTTTSGTISAATFSHVETGIAARSSSPNAVPPPSREELVDMNGDGKADLLVARGGLEGVDSWFNRGSCPGAVVIHLNTTPDQANAPISFSPTPAYVLCLFNSATVLRELQQVTDIDGDGVRDLLVRGQFDPVPGPQDRVHFGRRTPGGGYTTTEAAFSALGPDLRWWETPAWAQGSSWTDVNGDGLDDYYYETCYGKLLRINQGGASPGGVLGPRILLEGQTGAAPQNCPRPGEQDFEPILHATFSLPFDVDSDGRQEMLVPGGFASRMCINGGIQIGDDLEPATFCPRHPLRGICPPGVTGDCEPRFTGPGNDLDYQIYDMYQHGYQVFDRSLYVMDALKFIEVSPGQYRIRRVPTTVRLTAPRNNGEAPSASDIYGDGLQHGLTYVGCPITPSLCVHLTTLNGYVYGPSTLPNGDPLSSRQQYLSENLGAGPRASLPPRLPDVVASITDAMGDSTEWQYLPLTSNGGRTDAGFPLYAIPSRDSATGYLDERHFYFASSMNVVAAMLRSNGIGGYTGARSQRYSYQEAIYNHQGRGFQGFRSIASEDLDSATALFPGQSVRRTTTFHQRFPLTGRIESQQTAPALDPTNVLSRDSYSWRCNIANRAERCPGDGGPALVRGRSYSAFLDEHLTATYDLAAASGGAGLVSQVRRIHAASEAAAQSGWDQYGNPVAQLIITSDAAGRTDQQFISEHRLLEQQTYQPADTANWWLDRLGTRRRTASVSYAAGHQPPSGVNASSHEQLTAYVWNDTTRTLAQEMQQPGVADQELTRSYLYPATNYGQPDRVTTSGSGVLPRTDWIAASADGYFPQTNTDAQGGVTTTLRRARDGAVESVSDPNGKTRVTLLDPFGVPTQVEVMDVRGRRLEPLRKFAMRPGSGAVAYEVTSVQDGAPTTVVSFDALNRSKSTRRRAMDGRWLTELVEYDEMGRRTRESLPHFAGSTPKWRSYTYDLLGRMTGKNVPMAELDAVNGDQFTRYSYSGRTTRIIVRGANGKAGAGAGGGCEGYALCMDMQRSYDSLGQLSRTRDALSSATAYWYDALGNHVGLRDVAGNVMTARYNARGHKLGVVDPNMGAWFMTYNALGQMATQRDARDVLTTYKYDLLGRISSRAVGYPEGLGLADSFDQFAYDAPGAYGLPSSSSRSEGGMQTWAQQIAYDDSQRPVNVLTQLQGEARAWEERTAYDGYYGRTKARGFPSGLIVEYGYDAYGNANELRHPGSGLVYHAVQERDAWGGPLRARFGNGVVETSQAYASAELLRERSWSTAGPLQQDFVSYGYDSFANLRRQTRAHATASSVEEYRYDTLQRLSRATRTINGQVQPAVDYDYHPNGNLKFKSDYSAANAGAYRYGEGAGPNAVTSVTLANNGVATFSYDENGNLTGGNTLSGRYDAQNLPVQLQRGAINSFSYAPSGQLFRQVSSAGTTYFGDSGQEKQGARYRNELGPVIVTRDNGLESLTYVYRDRAGSGIALADSTGNIVERRSYDAFGRVRNGDLADRPQGLLGLLPTTLHGFTDHQHLDDIALIHMRGRAYDYQLGRFLGVDPVVQFAANSQSINPYSYILNNPFAGRDPSGYTVSCNSAGSNADPNLVSNVAAKSCSVSSPHMDNGVKTGTDVTPFQRSTGKNGETVFNDDYTRPRSNGARPAGAQNTERSDGSGDGAMGVEAVRTPGQQHAQEIVDTALPAFEVMAVVLENSSALDPQRPWLLAFGALGRAGRVGGVVVAGSGFNLNEPLWPQLQDWGERKNRLEDFAKRVREFKLGDHDQDWRGLNRSLREAVTEAFKQTGENPSEFKITEWALDENGKSFPVEWEHPSKAQVSIDAPHEKNGPPLPHVGFKSSGKSNRGGRTVGHIILDAVSISRPFRDTHR